MKLQFLCLLFSTVLFSQSQIGDDIDGEVAFDNSGSSVSMSGDGSVVAIGAPFNSSNGQFSGHVRVYEDQSGSWVQIGDDIDGEGPANLSGTSVSLSDDGTIIAIGAPLNVGNGFSSGHVRVYENQSGSWVQIGEDIDGENQGDESGTTVSLSGDGTVVAISSKINEDNGLSYGRVRVFENQSGIWVQIGANIDGIGVQGEPFASVSLSNDGSIVAIGEPFNDGNGLRSGRVSLYENQSETWVQIGDDITEGQGDEFGTSVSLSDDGTIVAIGAPYNGNGQASVYENQLGSWVQLGNDIIGDSFGDLLGDTVSLSGDGNVLAIIASGDDINNVFSGYVKMYKNQSGTWNQIGNTIDSEGPEDYFGSMSSISLSNDGNFIVIGVGGNDDNGEDAGHARIYESEVLSSEEFEENLFTVSPNPVQDILHIDLNFDVVLKEIYLYNVLGQFVSSAKSQQITTSHLKSGVYFLQLETIQGKKGMQKVVIE